MTPEEYKKAQLWALEVLGIDPGDRVALEELGIEDEEKAFAKDDYMAQREKERAVLETNNILATVSPPGALKLPTRLDARRILHGIPDGAFKNQPAYDRIWVWQLPEFTKNFGGMISLTDNLVKSEENSIPRGVVIGAGLMAMDEMCSHGMDIGHVVTFAYLSPWRHRVAIIGGKDVVVALLRAKDITGSEDTRKAIMAGRAHIFTRTLDDGRLEHFWQGENGKIWNPVNAPGRPDY
jgi:hypothetical protein